MADKTETVEISRTALEALADEAEMTLDAIDDPEFEDDELADAVEEAFEVLY